MHLPRLAVFVCLIVCLIAIGFSLRAPRRVKASAPTAPTYAKNGDMLPPANYREWIYLTSGIDMSYSPKAMDMSGMSMFDNVFVNPEAYRSFLATGTWPDKTVMILEGREARSKGSINQRGHYQAIDGFYGRGEFAGVGAVGQVFQPCRGVDDVAGGSPTRPGHRPVGPGCQCPASGPAAP